MFQGTKNSRIKYWVIQLTGQHLQESEDIQQELPRITGLDQQVIQDQQELLHQTPLNCCGVAIEKLSQKMPPIPKDFVIPEVNL